MYNYQTERPTLFTEEGQIVFLKIRDKAHELLKKSGAFKLSNVITGDTWLAMVCVDRLVELAEIREVTNATICGQDRVFVAVSVRHL